MRAPLTRRSALVAAGAGLFASAALKRPALAQTTLLRVGGTPNYGPVLPVHAANKLGLFEKLGLKVEFTGFAGGSAAMEAVAAGEADMINYFPPGVALAKQRGVAATIIGAGTLTPRGWKIMAKKDSPLSGVKDLARKKIGVSANGSTTDFFALWAAQQSGSMVSRIPLGGGGLIPGLLAGNVDAIVAYPPLSYQLESSGDAKVVVDLGTAMQPNLPDVWVAADKVLTQKKDAIQKALVGIYSATRYMKKNPDWTVNFIQEQSKFSPAVAKLEFENTIMGLSDDGTIKEEWVENSLALGRLAGLQELPSAKSMFSTEFFPVTAIDA
ncbi:ABC transporter substrate-binding protein [Roseomonas marmotae]|uniref:ABC transporter substrate-binding protein n=1 Tax=Roseomonas marmotae TaxID=2768161 RepID=A0ABS3K781_9PROT|nr:ABC transporter substrate-binding protein [Roseomonas marmotae]MBO1073330.1 ABC transporter substrate-binding protein [Roseomonas marmotae]QTI79055.1 ABC transporter substrate-binding protein [Roseomonas marmotae]